MPSEYSRNFGSSVGGLRSQSELFSASTSPTESTIRLYSSPSCSATKLIELPHSRGCRPRRRRTSIAVTMRPRRFREQAISVGASGRREILWRVRPTHHLSNGMHKSTTDSGKGDNAYVYDNNSATHAR